MSEDNQQPSPNELRTCKKCGDTKPLRKFHETRGRNGKVYRRHACHSCENARQAEWIREWKRNHWNDERRLANNASIKARYYALRAEVIEGYGGRCECCGERNPKFLAFDHVNNDGKRVRGKVHPNSGTPLLLWIKANNYPSMLRLLCHNCNMGREFNGGICPHREGSEAIPTGSTAEVSSSAAGSASHPQLGDDDMVRSLQ